MTFYDRGIVCKLILLVFSFLLGLIAMIVFGVVIGNVTESLTHAIIIAWFISVFGGWLIINIIRIFVIALLAPIIA